MRLDQHILADDAVDDAGVIAADVPCRSCGYDLRGLRRDGICPECGTPAHVSIGGWMLCFAPPGWLRRVSLGAMLCGIGAGSILLALLAAISLRLPERLLPELALLAAAGHVGGSIGSFLLSTPEPAIRPGSASDVPGRGQTRALMIVFNLLAVLAILLISTGWTVALFGAIVLFFDWFVLLAWRFAELDYASELIRRLVDFPLARCAWMAIFCIAMAGLLLPVGLCIGVITPIEFPRSMALGVALVSLLAVPYVLTMIGLARRLAREARVGALLRQP